MKNKSSLSLIFLTVFIDLLGFGILIPILPTFSTIELNLNEFSIGLVLAIYSLTQFIFGPILGNLSDRVGRRPLIIGCLFLNAVGYVIFAFTNSFMLLLISRVVAGVGGSSVAVAQAYIADITTKDNRSKGMGMIGAAFGLGFVFGPLIGGFLSKYGYEVTGFASASFSFMAFLFTIFFLPESLKKTADHATKKVRKLVDIPAVKVLFKNNKIAFLIIMFFILVFSVANIYGTFALIGYKVYKFNDMQNGIMYGIIGIVSAGVQGGLLRIITKYFSDAKIVIGAAFLMMIGLAMIPYAGNMSGLIIVTVVLAFGTGSLQPTMLSLISKNTSDTEQGFTLGVNQSFSAFARVLGPLWGGFAFEYIGYQYPFLTGAAFTAIILISSIYYLPKLLATKNIDD
ncbi:MAG: tetracycline resistance MFS efflux pump [Ignavibacteriales bacterium CG12_big_fil_rev_8_21_14_0_65_30_8]|nr:MAG: tetracycline resistance MFS efflux pump [Ignavibacteriales bacterium CG12_big_fil_rev_8_21_14_0_65_30_8]